MFMLLFYIFCWEIFAYIIYYNDFQCNLNKALQKAKQRGKLLIFIDDTEERTVIDFQNGKIQNGTVKFATISNLIDKDPIFFVKNIEYIFKEKYNEIQRILEKSYPENVFFVCNKWYSVFSYISYPTMPKRLLVCHPPSKDFIFQFHVLKRHQICLGCILLVLASYLY